MSNLNKINPFWLSKISSFEIDEFYNNTVRRRNNESANENMESKGFEEGLRILPTNEPYDLKIEVPTCSSSQVEDLEYIPKHKGKSKEGTPFSPTNIAIFNKERSKPKVKYSKEDDEALMNALQVENGSYFGPGITGNCLWDKIHERCQGLPNLKNRSAKSLKFRFLQNIQPSLLVLRNQYCNDNEEKKIEENKPKVVRSEKTFVKTEQNEEVGNVKRENKEKEYRKREKEARKKLKKDRKKKKQCRNKEKKGPKKEKKGRKKEKKGRKKEKKDNEKNIKTSLKNLRKRIANK